MESLNEMGSATFRVNGWGRVFDVAAPVFLVLMYLNLTGRELQNSSNWQRVPLVINGCVSLIAAATTTSFTSSTKYVASLIEAGSLSNALQCSDAVQYIRAMRDLIDENAHKITTLVKISVISDGVLKILPAAVMAVYLGFYLARQDRRAISHIQVNLLALCLMAYAVYGLSQILLGCQAEPSKSYLEAIALCDGKAGR
jgi:hypothetical protein